MLSFQNLTLEKVQYQYENWFKIYNYFDNVMFLYECRCKTFCGTRVVFTNHAPKFPSSLSSGLLERFFWVSFWIFTYKSKDKTVCWVGNHFCDDYGISSKFISSCNRRGSDEYFQRTCLGQVAISIYVYRASVLACKG